jgi:hypothetical protein
MSKNETEVEVEVEVEVDQTELAIRAAFDEAIGNEADEDQIKMNMIQAGATFKNVTRLYNQFMIDAGLAISKEEKDGAIEGALSGREFDTEENFNEAILAVLEAVVNSTERSAAALVRSYAKKNDLDVFTKPKGNGGGAGRSGFTSKLYDFLAANPRCTKEEVTAFVNGDGDHEDTTENVKRHMSLYLGIWSLVQRVVAAS